MQGKSRDNYTLLYIRRSIVGAFWSQENSTVLGKFRRLRRYYFNSIKVLMIRVPMPIIGKNEVRDRVGMVCAIQALDAPRRKVKRQDKLQRN